LVVLCGGLGLGAGPARGLSWSFDDGAQGWQAGVSLLALYLDGKTGTSLPVRGGVLEVAGTQVERIFMDSTGYIRRGWAAEQSICGPQVQRPTDEFARLRVRFRGWAGKATFWQVQWLTSSGLQAFLEQRQRRQELVLPDSVQSAMRAFAEGGKDQRLWGRFVQGWERGDGRLYAAKVNRLRQEEEALQALFQTEERRIEGTGDWQELEVEVRQLGGWKGELLALGIRVMQQPELLDVSVQGVAADSRPLVWIDEVVLEE
jgi:hypothetical protein